MKVYIDNNVLVDIENKRVNINAFKNGKKRFSYFYSYTHIQELLEYSKDFESLKKQRFKTIFDLTNNLYVFPYNSHFNTKIENPEIVLRTLKMFRSHLDLTRQKAQNFNVDRDKLISLLGIDRKRINNYSPSELIDFINNAFQSKLLMEFPYFVDLLGNSLHNKISTLFNILDFIGFWKDNQNNRSNVSRMYDSSHTYFASYCDIFITNDNRARKKAEVAYLFNKIQTKILLLEEFITFSNQKYIQ